MTTTLDVELPAHCAKMSAAARMIAGVIHQTGWTYQGDTGEHFYAMPIADLRKAVRKVDTHVAYGLRDFLPSGLKVVRARWTGARGGRWVDVVRVAPTPKTYSFYEARRLAERAETAYDAFHFFGYRHDDVPEDVARAARKLVDRRNWKRQTTPLLRSPWTRPQISMEEIDRALAWVEAHW